MKYKSF